MHTETHLKIGCYGGCGAALVGEAANHGILYATLGRKKGWTRMPHPTTGIGHVFRCATCSTRWELDGR